MLSPSTFLNLAKSLNVSSFSKMQDTKHSIFTENIDYIHKSFLIAHPPLGQRVGEEFEGLLIMPMLLEKEIGSVFPSMLSGTLQKLWQRVKWTYSLLSRLNLSPCLEQF